MKENTISDQISHKIYIYTNPTLVITVRSLDVSLVSLCSSPSQSSYITENVAELTLRMDLICQSCPGSLAC